MVSSHSPPSEATRTISFWWYLRFNCEVVKTYRNVLKSQDTTCPVVKARATEASANVGKGGKFDTSHVQKKIFFSWL